VGVVGVGVEGERGEKFHCGVGIDGCGSGCEAVGSCGWVMELVG
jgi:hypothetical protein